VREGVAVRGEKELRRCARRTRSSCGGCRAARARARLPTRTPRRQGRARRPGSAPRVEQARGPRGAGLMSRLLSGQAAGWRCAHRQQASYGGGETIHSACAEHLGCGGGGAALWLAAASGGGARRCTSAACAVKRRTLTPAARPVQLRSRLPPRRVGGVFDERACVCTTRARRAPRSLRGAPRVCMSRGAARQARPRARVAHVARTSWTVLRLFSFAFLWSSAALQCAHAWPLLFNGDGSSLLTSGYGADVLLSPDAGGACARQALRARGTAIIDARAGARRRRQHVRAPRAHSLSMPWGCGGAARGRRLLAPLLLWHEPAVRARHSCAPPHAGTSAMMGGAAGDDGNVPLMRSRVCPPPHTARTAAAFALCTSCRHQATLWCSP
jgi:hypothetical protein